MEFNKWATWDSGEPGITEPPDEKEVTFYALFEFTEYEIENMSDSLKGMLALSYKDEKEPERKKDLSVIRFKVDGDSEAFKEKAREVFNMYIDE